MIENNSEIKGMIIIVWLLMAKDKQRDYSFAHCYWKTNYFADFMANFGENQKGEDFWENQKGEDFMSSSSHLYRLC